MSGSEQIFRQELLARIKAAVLAVAPGAEVSLYGSHARGDAHEESDWDILVLLPEAPTTELKRKIRHRFNDIEHETEQVITSVCYSKQEWEHEDRHLVHLRRHVHKIAIRL